MSFGIAEQKVKKPLEDIRWLSDTWHKTYEEGFVTTFG